MKEEEIIKALECCAKSKTNGDCEVLNCQCFKNGMCIFVDDDYGLQNLALDLINRQKSEIEKLKRYYYRHEYDKWEKQIKSEAYKEFVERLEEKIGDCHIVSDGEYCGFDCGDIHGCIDNLLKEMVGEE